MFMLSTTVLLLLFAIVKSLLIAVTTHICSSTTCHHLHESIALLRVSAPGALVVLCCHSNAELPWDAHSAAILPGPYSPVPLTLAKTWTPFAARKSSEVCMYACMHACM